MSDQVFPGATIPDPVQAEQERAEDMRTITPTEQLVADRLAALDAIEADGDKLAAFRREWMREGREWLLLRSGAGVVDYDLNVAEALWLASMFAETPWRTREPVAVVRGKRMREPPDADSPWALRFANPANKRDKLVTVAAIDLVTSPEDWLQHGWRVELLHAARDLTPPDPHGLDRIKR